MAADIDSIALDVARRFTEEWDPQRRASLQVAIIQAIRSAHPQPAELAEQQGDTHVLVLREMRARLTDAGSPARTGALDAAIAALAATGKQQVGEVQQPEYIRDVHDVEQGLIRNQKYTPAKQIGDVQGDVLPPMPKCHDRRPDDMPGYMESALDWVRDPDNCDAVEWLVENHAAIRAALAARQPVAQDTGWSGWATQKPGHMPKLWGTREIAELNHDLTGDARLIFLSEQPAQGIDLGQLWEPIKQAVHVALSVHVAAMSQKKREQVAVYVARQLRAGQPDAAPGVGS